MVLVFWPVGVDMMAPAGMVGAVDEVVAPAVERVIAEEVIARSRAAAAAQGVRRRRREKTAARRKREEGAEP
jgi:hypothetical protein